jgi:hypothetical protein
LLKLVLCCKAYELLVEAGELMLGFSGLDFLGAIDTHEFQQPSLHEVDSHRLQVSSHFEIETSVHQRPLDLDLNVVSRVRVSFYNQPFEVVRVLLGWINSVFWQVTVSINLVAVV